MNLPYKKFIPWIIVILIMTIIIYVLIFLRVGVEKQLQLTSPSGSEQLQAGQSYQITWNSRHISKVGLMLVQGERFEERKIIAEDISAGDRSYNWEIFVWQKPEENYKIAIFEHPWREGGTISYSNDYFTILGPQFASCDQLSIENEWPYVPSDFPELKKVFITKDSYSGNLGGLEGADEKCQVEAEEREFDGEWKAFLGGDSIFAVERLDLEGIFVMAQSLGDLAQGQSCHRLLGKNFNEFFQKLSDPIMLNQKRFLNDFFGNLQNVWLGRINRDSKRECLAISYRTTPREVEKLYSFTSTCHNWSTNREIVEYFPLPQDSEVELPICYTPTGERVGAAALAGLSSQLVSQSQEQAGFIATNIGKTCNTSQKLICVQQ